MTGVDLHEVYARVIADLLPIGFLGTNVGEIGIEIEGNELQNVVWKTSAFVF